MKLQLAALCEAANVSAEGKINILGEFDTINTPSTPTFWPLMVFVAKLKIGQTDIGEHSVSLRVLDEDMQLVADPVEGAVRIAELPASGIETGWPLILRIGNAQFKTFGTYTFEFRVDGATIVELPLHVQKIPAASHP